MTQCYRVHRTARRGCVGARTGADRAAIAASESERDSCRIRSRQGAERVRVLRKTVICVAVGWLCGLPAPDAGAEPAAAWRPGLQARVQADWEQHRRRYADDPDMFVRPGLVADRRTGEVRLSAAGIGLSPGSPVEFFLISASSGKDYEALAISFAKPSDVHRALNFVGMSAGRPGGRGAGGILLWPRGERVTAVLEWDELGRAPESEPRRARLEAFLVDTRSGRSPPTMGFVFVGSRQLSGAAATGTESVYAADVATPQAIISAYNEPGTVLDVPRRLTQTEVYNSHVPNPELLLPPGQPLTVVMRPEYTGGQQRVLACRLRVEAAAAPAAAGLAGLRFQLAADSGRALAADVNLVGLLALLERLRAGGQDPFVTVSWVGDMTLAAVRDFCRLLETLDTSDGIRVEPPPAGDLYYRAFLPDAAWRHRVERAIPVPELRLQVSDRGAWGTLIGTPRLGAAVSEAAADTVRKFTAASAPELVTALGELKNPAAALLVYAPEATPYAVLRALLRPLLESGTTVFVFVGSVE